MLQATPDFYQCDSRAQEKDWLLCFFAVFPTPFSSLFETRSWLTWNSLCKQGWLWTHGAASQVLGLKGFAPKPSLLEVCVHWYRSRAMSVSPRIHRNEAESVFVFLVLTGALLKTFLFLLTLECENFSAFSFLIYLVGAGIPSLHSILHLPK